MKTKPAKHNWEFAGGDIRFWIDQNASIHMKSATEKHNDPVELTAQEAREVANALLEAAQNLEKIES